MSNIEKGFVPLPKAEQGYVSDNIALRLNLPPFVDKDRIGVNLRGLEKLCRMGGIRNLVVVATLGNETSSFVPNIVGQNPDGSALASKAGVRTNIPTYQSLPEKDTDSRGVLSNRWIDLRMNLNTDEIALRIREKDTPVVSAGAWAKALDGILKQGVVREGTRHSIFDARLLETVVMYGTQPNLFITFGPIMAITVDMLSLPILHAMDRARGRDDRISLFYQGPEFDRALLLNILGRTTTLVKDLHPDKK